MNTRECPAKDTLRTYGLADVRMRQIRVLARACADGVFAVSDSS